jgi:SulP family sulfate permease
MLHAVYILVFMILAAPLIARVPLAALAAVLVVVSWNMADRSAFVGLLKSSAGDRVVLLATFLLTVFYDLATAIVVGVTLGSLLFMHRMAQAVDIETHGHSAADVADDIRGRSNGLTDLAAARDLVVYRINGPFFFGATATAGSALDALGEHPRAFILDFAGVPFIDSTGAATLDAFVGRLEKSGTRVTFSTVAASVRRSLAAHRLDEARIRFAATLDGAIAEAKA